MLKNNWVMKTGIFSFSLILVFILPMKTNVFAEDFVSHTIKQYNLKLRFPYTWRWKQLNPQRKDGRIFEVFSPNRKMHLNLWVEPTKSMNTMKSFHSFLRKWNIEIEETPDFSTAEYPNLQALHVYISKFKEKKKGVNYSGYLFTGTDGIWEYTFKFDIENSELEAGMPIITEILSGIDSNFDWQQVCCAACLKEIRYSVRRTTLCSDFVVEQPCYQFFKNSKMNYEDCR